MTARAARWYPDLLLFPQHEELLAASGILPSVASARGYLSADTKAHLARLGFSKNQQHVPALLVPVWSAASGHVVFYQARPDLPRVNDDGKAIKYETPANIRMALDAHPLIRGRLGDPAVRLWITEGIRKADALVSANECCVALLGVWNWRGRNEHGGKAALPDWDAIALNERDVYLVFDSDVMLKREVHVALRRLAAFLEAHDARIHFVYLPQGEAGAKVGADDYLAAGHAVEELLALAADELRAPVSGPVPVLADLLDDVAAFFRRFVAFASPHQVTATALWVVHAHVYDQFDVSPFLHVSSPEKRSGKTRLLEVMELFVRAPWRIVSPSEAVLYRKIDAEHPTLLLDEVDAVFGRGRDDAHEPLRALLNAGNRPGVTVPRCVGDGTEIRLVEFSVFTPRVLAGIGTLPDTVADRCVPVRLRRRAPQEAVERFRFREASEDARPIREALERWAFLASEALERARPEVPVALNDRAAELWEPLLAIADLAGGDWPRRAREAAVALHGDPAAKDETMGVALLSALHDIFDARTADRLGSAELIDALSEREDVALPDWWARAARDDLRSAGRWLARRLRAFGIEPDKWRVGTDTVRGYIRGTFADAWSRYAPDGASLSPEETLHATHATSLVGQGPEPDSGHATLHATEPYTPQRQPLQDNVCGVVAGNTPVLKGGDAPPDGQLDNLEAVRRWGPPVEVEAAPDSGDTSDPEGGPSVPGPDGACSACGGSRFWRSAAPRWICARCHPPAVPERVLEWRDLDTPETSS